MRAVWVVLGLGGVGILLYVILWIMLEDEPADLEVVPAETDAGDQPGIDETTPAQTPAEEPSETREGGEPEPRSGDDSGG